MSNFPTRIIVRIFAIPLLCGIGAFVLPLLFAHMAEQFSRSVYLQGLVPLALDATYYSGFGMALASGLLGTLAYVRLWLWENGYATCCDHCGGPMGFDDRCLNCQRRTRHW